MPHRVALRLIRQGLSLRTRLTLWVVGMLFLVQAVTSTIVFLYQRSVYIDSFDDILAYRAQNIAEEVEAATPPITWEQLSTIAKEEQTHSRVLTFETDLLDSDGRSMHGSTRTVSSGIRQQAAAVIKKSKAIFGFVDLGNEKAWSALDTGFRYTLMPLRTKDGKSCALLVITRDDYLQGQVGLVIRMLLIAGVISLAASAISGWYVAGLAVRPLHSLRSVAEQLGPESISRELKATDRFVEVAQLTEALEDARKRIHAAFAAQERFLSNVSHEIKTPIATILLEAQTINRTGLSEDARGFIRTAEEEMRKLGRLVESFLTLTRLHDGKGMVVTNKVLVNDIVMEAMSGCQAMAGLHGITVTPTLVEGEEFVDAMVIGDLELLRTLLENLIRNAIRFSPKGGVVAVTAAVQGQAVKLTVEDEGPGVPPELGNRIFDRFVQAPDEHRKSRGHGLGLAIAQGVAELHGGIIRVENRPSGGARFCVELPLYIPSAPGPDRFGSPDAP